jgi:hypothetical protein
MLLHSYTSIIVLQRAFTDLNSNLPVMKGFIRTSCGSLPGAPREDHGDGCGG